MEDHERQRTELVQNINSATHQLGELPLTSLNQENTIRSKPETLRQELAKTAGGNVLLVRAPANGIVSAMTVNPGQRPSPPDNPSYPSCRLEILCALSCLCRAKPSAS
jgi:membrane fusion protein